jgi:hypothetical protein
LGHRRTERKSLPRHSGASQTVRAKRGPVVTNPESRGVYHFWIPGSHAQRVRPGMTVLLVRDTQFVIHGAPV